MPQGYKQIIMRTENCVKLSFFKRSAIGSHEIGKQMSAILAEGVTSFFLKHTDITTEVETLKSVITWL